MNAKFSPTINLVDVDDGKPHTTTLQIALGLGLQHASVIKLVRTYRPDFTDLGPIRFEIRKGEALGHGGFAKSTEFAVLDEQQATFLMTLLRNSPRVIAFKKALVKAFFEARSLLHTDYFSLIKQREALSARLDCEKDIASACGKGLAIWRRQRDTLQTAIANVDRQLQPCLFE
ncbi:phage regulator Rha-like protein [Acinetobacter calcoaceticus]|uniref:Phage regulator Rha-like protein n=1 Tax=Acinetobacter calcoaceticus TaxID=471 RepID=A0A4R1XKS0_ACICA|nr:phage regulator Rha-like protein [Acinetobacter calcoaceticus]